MPDLSKLKNIKINSKLNSISDKIGIVKDIGRLIRPLSKVTIKGPSEALFVGSYARIEVSLSSVSGLTFEDLVFVIPAGPAGGMVSVCREPDFTPTKFGIMLCAGFRPGEYQLEVRNKTTNDLLAKMDFKINDLWLEEKTGPSLSFTGINQSMSTGAAWGGGPAGPQNMNVVPATGTRRIAIVLVDTATQRFDATPGVVDGFKTRLLDEIVNGVASGGLTRSTAAFYREASYNNFNLSAQAFGPVNLSGNFSDYINDDGSMKGGYPQAVITAADGLINYNDFDTILCVSQSVTGADPKSAWPYASIGAWGPYTTSEGNKNLGIISMPNEWGMSGDREFLETFAHELGHNLGLGDQYTPVVGVRNPGSWEMMHWDDVFPHFSVAHRMMLGWVPSAWVKTYNFSSMAIPVDEVTTLHPIALGTPPAGRKSVIEVRLADGWNYYYEYRKTQGGGAVADQNLPTDSRVLGTDVVSPPWTPPIARPAILLLNDDADGDGSVLGNGQDYEETDNTDPIFPTDFKVEVSGIDGNKADVRVRYGVNSKPDPSIRPWPASAERQWQSPDIEVRNEKTIADPATWFNTPWAGHDNTIVAKVKNNGTIDAPQVRVNFSVKNYNVGGAPETPVGSQVLDIPAGATVEFSTNWVPPSEGHYCVVVRIPLYQIPGTATVEMTELNNLAQSNYSQFVSASASPATREVTEVEVGNPYDKATRIFLIPGQSNPLYRTYLEHTWLWLEPGETRKVKMMFEYTPDVVSQGDPNIKYLPKDEAGAKNQQNITHVETNKEVRKYIGQPNLVRAMAQVEDPRCNPRHAIQVLGGLDVRILTGKATKFQEFFGQGERLGGRIGVVSDNTPVPSGKVVAEFWVDKEGKQKKYAHGIVTKGSFTLKAPLTKWVAVQAFYLPPAGYGECESNIIKQ